MAVRPILSIGHPALRARAVDGVAPDDVVRGLTAATWQHECDHLDGVLFLDRVTNPLSVATWHEFAEHHRDAFVERISAFVERVGS